MPETDFDERAIATTSVQVQVPQEAFREYRALYSDEPVESDALGNSTWAKSMGVLLTQLMGTELVDTDEFRVRPDGSLKPVEESEGDE